MMVGCAVLRPGDVIAYRPLHWEGDAPSEPIMLTVLRHREEATDFFGRPMIRYWVKGKADHDGNPSDTEREGFMTYGPGAMVELASRAPTALVKCGSHRARGKLLRLFEDERDAESLYSLTRETGKGVYRIPADMAAKAKAITGVAGFRDGEDLRRCWPSRDPR